MLLSTASAHIVTPALTPKIGYDGIRDFAFVAMIASVPNVLVVRSTLPVNDVEALIALAKLKPGTLNYGSVGNGKPASSRCRDVPADDRNEAQSHPVQGRGAGDHRISSPARSIRLPQRAGPVAAHRVRKIAGAGGDHNEARRATARRSTTLDELGLKGFDVATWYGITAPPARPAIVERLASVLGKVLASPEIKAKFTAQGTRSLPAAAEGDSLPMCGRMPSASPT